VSKSIIFTGYVPSSDLRIIYRAADVFVFPSEFDTFGLVVVESMASGVPIVVKKGTAPEELIVEGKNGYLFNDSFDFPEVVLKTVKESKALSETTLELSKQYDIKNSVNRIISHYNSAMESKSNAKKDETVKGTGVASIDKKKEVKK